MTFLQMILCASYLSKTLFTVKGVVSALVAAFFVYYYFLEWKRINAGSSDKDLKGTLIITILASPLVWYICYILWHKCFTWCGIVNKAFRTFGY